MVEYGARLLCLMTRGRLLGFEHFYTALSQMLLRPFIFSVSHNNLNIFIFIPDTENLYTTP